MRFYAVVSSFILSFGTLLASCCFPSNCPARSTPLPHNENKAYKQERMQITGDSLLIFAEEQNEAVRGSEEDTSRVNDTAVLAIFEGVAPLLFTGETQTSFIVKFYNKYGLQTSPPSTLTGDLQRCVTFHGAAEGNYCGMVVDSGDVSQCLFLSFSAQAFSTIGTYTLSIPGIQRYKGNRVFTVEAPSFSTPILRAHVFQALEVRFISERIYSNPHTDLALSAEFIHRASGEKRCVMGFWDGDSIFCVRACLPRTGTWQYLTTASDTTNDSLHHRQGVILVSPYDGANPLYAKGTVKIAPNKRTLAYANNEPFFYLGDTAWEFTKKSTLSEARNFLLDRKKKGFTALQMVAFSHLSSFVGRNRNGETPYLNNDFMRPNPRFFRYLDTLVALCNEFEIIPVIAPLWGHMTKTQYSPYYAPSEQLSDEEGKLLAQYIGARCAGAQTMWIMGGDQRYQTPAQQSFWSGVAHAIQNAGGREHLTTVHPAGYTISLDFFDNTTSWIDFVMYQSSHVAYGNNFTWQAAERSWNAYPIKPTLNGESVYEDIYNNLWEPGDTTQYQTTRIVARNVRRAAFESILGGALMGITYGANGIFQWSTPLDMGPFLPRFPVEEAQNFPASAQMIVLKRLMQQYSWADFRPQPSLIIDALGTRHIPLSASTAHLMAYLSDSTRFLTLNLSTFGKTPRAVWYNPATGDSTDIHLLPNASLAHYRFTPPTEDDWVLAVTYNNTSTNLARNTITQEEPVLNAAPNPAQNHIIITYTLPTDAEVQIEILDALQRIIALPLRKETQKGGLHTFTMQTAFWADGMYWLRLRTVDMSTGKTQNVFQRIIVIK